MDSNGALRALSRQIVDRFFSRLTLANLAGERSAAFFTLLDTAMKIKWG